MFFILYFYIQLEIDKKHSNGDFAVTTHRQKLTNYLCSNAAKFEKMWEIVSNSCIFKC